MREIWKPIPGNTGYEVSDYGRVRSVDRVVRTGTGDRRYRGRVLRPGRASHGYLTVSLTSVSFCVHELVLTAFVGPRPSGHIGFHEDDDPSNNRLDNLKWATPSQNNKNITKLGKRMFTYQEAERIRERLRSGETALELSAEYGCTRRHIYHIKNEAQYVES